MNIETPTLSATISADAKTVQQTASKKTSQEETNSFKKELEGVKESKNKKKVLNENDSIESKNTTNKILANNDLQLIAQTQTAAAQNNPLPTIAQTAANQNNPLPFVTQTGLIKNTSKDATKTTDITNPLNELNSQISTLNELKNNFSLKPEIFEQKISSKDEHIHTLKMDSKDTQFFLNLIQNQQLPGQNNQENNINNTTFQDIKTEITQKNLQVSSILLDALKDSMKTNQPFRIDFDNNIAVILKVNKDGALSANFIPGDAAVENYLRNNMASLKQNFDQQNLPSENLSYSKNKQQQQQQQKNKEENKNE